MPTTAVDTVHARVDIPVMPRVTTGPDRAVLRQTLYRLTRPIGDLPPGLMVAPLTADGHPTARGAFVVEDGAERHAYATAADVALVSGLCVLVDHVDGYSLAFADSGVDEPAIRRFAAATLALPAVAGVWIGEVIRQH